jgi:hypothetical protein
MPINVNLPDFVNTSLEVIDAATDDRQSLSEIATASSLNPISMMSADIVNTVDRDMIHSINQVHLSAYTAMLVKAVHFIIPHQGDIKEGGKITVESILEPLSDRAPRPLKGSILTSIGEFIADLTLESFDASEGGLLGQFDAESYKDTEISKPTNLSVGKTIEVKLPVGKKEVTIPLTATIRPQVVDTAFLNKVLLAFIGKDQSIMGRWNRMLAGELKLDVGYALGFDIISEDRKLRLDDKDGIYSLIKRNKSRARIASAAKGRKLDFNVSSNMIMTTPQGRREIEASIRGNLSNFRKREQFLSAVGCMMYTVVDPVNETVTMFLKGIEQRGVYSFEELKGADKNSNHHDINAMLKSFKLGESFGL